MPERLQSSPAIKILTKKSILATLESTFFPEELLV